MFLTFEAPEDVVRIYIPPGVEPEWWHGKTHVSVVALQMLNIRVLGWRIPGFTAHPQVNFRVYARLGADPAVVFVRELVPSRLLATVARLRYREPFQPIRIDVRGAETADGVTAEYRFGPRGHRYSVAVVGSHATRVPPAGSFEHHLKERTHGCRIDRHGRLQTFRVEHPPWAVRDVQAVDYDVDFGTLYGAQWRFLNGRKPVSVIFALGSDVAVYPPSVIHHPSSARSGADD